MKSLVQLREEYNAAYRDGRRGIAVQGYFAAATIAKLVRRHLHAVAVRLPHGAHGLDVGCATGDITAALARQGLSMVGIDYSDVALEQARRRFPTVRFVEMDGFNPSFDRKFDLIMCRGFSGCNTHDLTFVGALLRKYISLLNPRGILVVGFPSDLSGRPDSRGMANWSEAEVNSLCSSLPVHYLGLRKEEQGSLLVMIRSSIRRLLSSSKKGSYYYLYLQAA